MRDININSGIKKLHDKGLITTKCMKILNALEVKDAFDIMTTTFPDEGTIIPSDGKELIYSKRIHNEINSLVNTLYKI